MLNSNIYLLFSILSFAGLVLSGAGFVLLISSASKAESRSERVLKICGSIGCLFMLVLMMILNVFFVVSSFPGINNYYVSISGAVFTFIR